MGHVSRIKHTGDGEGFAMSFDNGNNHSSGVAGIPFLKKIVGFRDKNIFWSSWTYF